jgi:hypothetical protein
MGGHTNLVSAGGGIAGRNWRYLVWFYMVSLILVNFAAMAFSTQSHTLLSESH